MNNVHVYCAFLYNLKILSTGNNILELYLNEK